MPLLASACERESFQCGATLVKQGDLGDVFYVIESGSVTVRINNRLVNTLGPKAYFGERALLKDEPRNATVTASSAVSALAISRPDFVRLGLDDKLSFPKRHAVHGGAGRSRTTRTSHSDSPSPRPPRQRRHPRTACERERIMLALRTNKNLQDMISLEDKTCRLMTDNAWLEEVCQGQEVVTEGDTNANHMYIVERGEFEVCLPGHRDVSLVVKQGESFGELALLYSAPRAATVRALTDATVWLIDRDTFQLAQASSAHEIARADKSYLDGVHAFDTLTEEEKMEVAMALNEAVFYKGESIFQQGEQGVAFYILYDGEVDVVKDDAVVTSLRASAEQRQVQFFGETALQAKCPRTATVTVTSEVARALYLDKTSFELLGRWRPGWASPSKRRIGDMRRANLATLGLLGCGGFGSVELVEHCSTKDVFALRSISKGYLVQLKMQKAVMQEKVIQFMLDSPFIVKLYATYNSAQALSFLLELAAGGELYQTYMRKGLHGSAHHARFYVAGVVLAFEHMHEKKIIHRDLKPENALLTGDGHVKLADMGLAKIAIGKAFTCCGTPEYFAPELLACTGHGQAVDWWTLGVFTFELMKGATPFVASTDVETYAKVRKGIEGVTFPSAMHGPCQEFITGLCQSRPELRLPMRTGGLESLKGQSWYCDFDWHAMENRRLSPPFRPATHSGLDNAGLAASICRSNHSSPPQIAYVDDGSGWDRNFEGGATGDDIA